MKCEMCGVCCKIFYIPLTKEEFASGKFETEFQYVDVCKESFEEIEKNGWNLLRKKLDGCVYLKEGKCSIHDSKPSACREFCCKEKSDSEGHKLMCKMIEENKK